MEFNRKNILAVMGILAFAITFYLLMNKLGSVIGFLGRLFDVIFPLVLGACIAFILNIPMNSFEKKLSKVKQKGLRKRIYQKKKGIALVLAMVSVITVLALVLCIVIPQIASTMKELPATFMRFWNRLLALAEENVWVRENILEKTSVAEIDWKAVWDAMNSYVFSGAGTVLSISISLATSLIGAIVDCVIAIIFAIYILLQKEKLKLQAKKILYAFFSRENAERVQRFGSMASLTFSNFFTGQFLEACILGMLFLISMTIFRLPYAMTISVLITITALIPVCGAFIGCVVGAFLIIMVAPMKAVWFVIWFLILQQIENNLIYPRVVGSSVGLPALWVLAAITIGGSLMGVAGMVIFVPLFSVLYVIIRAKVHDRLRKKKLRVTEEGIIENT